MSSSLHRASVSLSTLAILLLAVAPACGASGENFDRPAPYNWSRTIFPLVIANGHQLAREDPCADTCLPAPALVSGFHVTRCADDREGLCRSISGTPACDAYALRRLVPRNLIADSHSSAYIAATGMGAGGEQRVGLVARASVANLGGAWTVLGGYTAFLLTFSGTSSPVEGVVQIVRLDGTTGCVEDGTLLASSTPFPINCNEEFRLKFFVVDSTLRATLDRITIGAGLPVSASVILNPATNEPQLVVEDSTFPNPGLNGVVGYTTTPGTVYWDDVRVHSITTASFDTATSGAIFGSQASQSPGATFHTEAGINCRLSTVTPPGSGSTPVFGSGQFVATPPPLGGGLGARLQSLGCIFESSLATSATDLQILFGRLPGSTPQDRWINLSLGGMTFIGPLAGVQGGWPAENYDVDPFALDNAGGGQTFRLDINTSMPLTSSALGGNDAIIDAAHFGTPVSECLADFNADGVLSVQDIFDFLNAYFSNSIAADITGDGAVSVQDIFEYLTLYFAGC